VVVHIVTTGLYSVNNQGIFTQLIILNEIYLVAADDLWQHEELQMNYKCTYRRTSKCFCTSHAQTCRKVNDILILGGEKRNSSQEGGKVTPSKKEHEGKKTNVRLS
jgi:hypothetical protein